MKPGLKLFCSFIIITLFIVYACNKKEALPGEADKYASYKEWIHANAGTYSNETISIKTKDGSIITGSLNWDKVDQLVFEGKSYIYVPFNFKVGGKLYNNLPYDSAAKAPEAAFRLVLRQNDAGTYDVALNTKLYGVSLAVNGTLENYCSVDGSWINSWFYEQGYGDAEKVYKSMDKSKKDATNLMAEPVDCEDIPVTTYEQECWYTGGPNNETACTTIITTTYYTYCYNSGGSGGTGGGSTGGGGGGSYPPSGGDGGSTPTSPAQDPCAAAKPASQNATDISKSAGYTSGLNKVKTAASDNKEHGVSLNKSSNGDISSTAVSNGGEGSNDQPITTATVATIHNHPNGLPPSAGDVYGLITGNMAHKAFTTKYVTLPNGNMYALVITNPLSASRFKVKYPAEQTGNYPPDFGSGDGIEWGNNDPYDDYVNCWTTLSSSLGMEKATAIAIALVLDKYNAGIALLKYEDGSFKKLGTIQTGTGSNVTYSEINCPPVGGY